MADDLDRLFQEHDAAERAKKEKMAERDAEQSAVIRDVAACIDQVVLPELRDLCDDLCKRGHHAEVQGRDASRAPQVTFSFSYDGNPPLSNLGFIMGRGRFFLITSEIWGGRGRVEHTNPSTGGLDPVALSQVNAASVRKEVLGFLRRCLRARDEG